MLAGAGTGKTTTLCRAGRVADRPGRGARARPAADLHAARRARDARARALLPRALAQGPARGAGGGRHLPLGRPPLRAPPRVGARPAGRLRRARRRRRGRPARPRAPGGTAYGQTGRRFPRKATLLDIYSRTVNAQRPLRERAGRGLPVVRATTPTTSRGCSSTTARASAGSGVLDLDDLLLYWRALAQRRGRRRRSSARGDRPRARRRVPGRQRAPGRPRPRRCAASGPTSPWSATTCRRSTASARPRAEHILAFPEHFPGAAVVTLERNYRSTQPLLDVANAVAAQAERALPQGAARRAPGRPRARARAVPRRGRAGDGGLRARARRARAGRRAARAGGAHARRRTTPTCSSSSSRAATSRTSSTAGCATSRPRTSRTSWPCCAWPTTRPTSWRGSACCSCSRASGRRPRGACSRRSSPTPAAWSTCSRAGRPRTARSRPRRADRRTPWSRPWAPRSDEPAAGRARRGAARRAGSARRGALPRRRRAPARPRRAGGGRRPVARPRPLRRRPRARSAGLELGPGRARQPRRGLARAHHGALGQGPRVALGPRARALRRQLPLRHGGGRSRGDRGGAPAALRRAHAGSARPAPLRAAALLPPPARASTTATGTASRRASSPPTSSRCAVAPTAPGSMSTRPARSTAARGSPRIEVSVDALFR